MRMYRVLILASVLLMGIERGSAEPIVFFLNQPGAIPEQSITAAGIPFAIQIDANGGFTRIFQNATGLLITDFHLTSMAPEDAVWQGGGGAPPPFFQLVTVSPDKVSIDFFQGPLGTGIAPGEIFEITGIGFLVNEAASLNAIATVPEPSAFLLCCMCLLVSITKPAYPRLKSRVKGVRRPRRFCCKIDIVGEYAAWVSMTNLCSNPERLLNEVYPPDYVAFANQRTWPFLIMFIAS